MAAHRLIGSVWQAGGSPASAMRVSRSSVSSATPRGKGGSAGSVAGIPQSGEGGACGPRKFGQVTKSVGCKPGLQCLRNICQKPPA